ncbi:Probable ABC-type iron(III)-transport system, binding protein precursor component [Flavobacterium indicum GPTSA100-9 = DSM 17447]|uniref:Probable ABC-type iron(III)-transport system, binding protein component n=1 Tax=Flavobacterium indicum (strain DSM 17447 / CIP 109464 / GPTSA100-9) TaxID=1094466 RepID=H8XUA5_FLAIG|nr:ABC transporter substrate-binding protein [Flavobacterium indicum]CCG52888.1 Probable ABC-type iron(III)-transport system, binding protein precursor component [Flavobacterium indicum GPTSA100-9 = DSM 17447]
MKSIRFLFFSFFCFILFNCKENNSTLENSIKKNSITHAKSLSIEEGEDFTVVKVTNPWPNAKETFTYVLRKNKSKIPSNLSQFPVIDVPLKSSIVTSTTIIPFLEQLGVEEKLIGFPHTDYISSEKTRTLIEKGKIANVGQNENLNIEKIIELNPDVLVSFCVDNVNPTLKNLEKNGIKIIIQADWMEQTPLGKAEWIKLYGALFSKEKEANDIFNSIEKNYKKALSIIKNEKKKPSILLGSLYQDQWFVPNGKSWLAYYMKDAKSNYLWQHTEGTGSTPLSFEKVLEVAHAADKWITSGFSSLNEMKNANPNYAAFDAFKKGEVYSFEVKKGKTGGVIYYEQSPSRPDLVLQDFIKILHPELMKDYEFTFATKIN